MAITVPQNPFSVGVAIGPTNSMGGLQAAPKSEYSTTALLDGVSDQFGKFAQQVDKWQAELDAVRAKDLITQLEEKRLDLRYNKDTGYETLRGVNALERPDGKSLVEEVGSNFKTSYEQIRQKAGNVRQKAALDAYFQDASTKLQADVGGWTFKQAQVYQVDQAQSQLRVGMQQALSDDPEQQQAGEAVIRDSAQTFARLSGTSVDMSKYMGPIHAMRVSKMIDDLRPDQAKAYLSAHRDEMTPQQIAQADKYVRAGLHDQKEKHLAAGILANVKTESEAIKAAAGADEKSRDGVVRLVMKHFARIDAEKRARVEEVNDAVWNYVAGCIAEGREVNVPTTLMTDLKDLDAKSYVNLCSRLAKLERGEKISTDMEVWGELKRMQDQDPERFSRLNRNRFAGQISSTDLKALMKDQQQLSNSDRKAFISDVEKLANQDKRLKPRINEVSTAAGEWFDQTAAKYDRGVIPRDMLERGKSAIVGKLEGSGWFSETKRGFEVINDEGNVLAPADGIFTGQFKTGSEADNRKFVEKRLGIPLTSMSQEQLRVADSLRRGYGWPPEIRTQAWQIAQKQARESKLNPNAPITERDLDAICAALVFQKAPKKQK